MQDLAIKVKKFGNSLGIILPKHIVREENIKEAVQKGIKKVREDHSVIAEFRWFKVIYREYNLKQIRKIYPITVY